jgi:hypothetical protein
MDCAARILLEDDMATFRSKPFEVEATQWLKNGDHPRDESKMMQVGEEPFLSEGKVVRYFRHPDVRGTKQCQHCNRTMHEHGWIDTRQGGHTVCPGDWIITEPDGTGFYPCKPNVFEAKYEPAEEAREF